MEQAPQARRGGKGARRFPSPAEPSALLASRTCGPALPSLYFSGRGEEREKGSPPLFGGSSTRTGVPRAMPVRMDAGAPPGACSLRRRAGAGGDPAALPGFWGRHGQLGVLPPGRAWLLPLGSERRDPGDEKVSVPPGLGKSTLLSYWPLWCSVQTGKPLSCRSSVWVFVIVYVYIVVLQKIAVFAYNGLHIDGQTKLKYSLMMLTFGRETYS